MVLLLLDRELGWDRGERWVGRWIWWWGFCGVCFWMEVRGIFKWVGIRMLWGIKLWIFSFFIWGYWIRFEWYIVELKDVKYIVLVCIWLGNWGMLYFYC